MFAVIFLLDGGMTIIIGLIKSMMVILNPFGPFWFYSVHSFLFGPSWSYSVCFGLNWSIITFVLVTLGPFGPTQSILVILSPLSLIRSILLLFYQFWSSLVHFSPNWSSWSYLVLFGPFWSYSIHLVQFDPIRSTLVLIGPFGCNEYNFDSFYHCFLYFSSLEIILILFTIYFIFFYVIINC